MVNLKIVVVINCFVGIVYIYMVVEVIEEKVKLLGYEVYVEI